MVRFSSLLHAENRAHPSLRSAVEFGAWLLQFFGGFFGPFSLENLLARKCTKQTLREPQFSRELVDRDPLKENSASRERIVEGRNGRSHKPSQSLPALPVGYLSHSVTRAHGAGLSGYKCSNICPVFVHVLQWYCAAPCKGPVAPLLPGVSPREVSRYRGMSQLHLRMSCYAVQLKFELTHLCQASVHKLSGGLSSMSEAISGAPGRTIEQETQQSQ